MSNKREHFRLEYPATARPKLSVEKWTFDVVDLSERGVKFDCGPRYKPIPNTQIKGTITFKDGKTVQIAGTVLRHIADKNHCVLTLTQGVPYAKMLEEQRYLLRQAQGA